MRTWYIEDAGGGCRAFSEVLVLVSEKPFTVYTARVPLSWNEPQHITEKVCMIMQQLIKKAGVKKDDLILVCSGNIFTALHQWLTSEGYNWQKAKIEGLAHHLAEEEFARQVSEAGVPPEIKLTDRNYRDYYRQIEKWVGADPERKRYLKDMRLRTKPVGESYRLLINGAHSRRCNHCRAEILPYAPMVVFRRRQNGKRITRRYHPGCSPCPPAVNHMLTHTAPYNGSRVEGVIIPLPYMVNCAWCGQQIAASETGFWAYYNNSLLAGHLHCTGYCQSHQ